MFRRRRLSSSANQRTRRQKSNLHEGKSANYASNNGMYIKRFYWHNQHPFSRANPTSNAPHINQPKTTDASAETCLTNVKVLIRRFL